MKKTARIAVLLAALAALIFWGTKFMRSGPKKENAAAGSAMEGEAEAAVPVRVTELTRGDLPLRLTVTASGLMKICALQPSAWFNFGNIMEIESPVAQERFNSFMQLPAPGYASCKDCKHLAYCMNCHTRAFNLLITQVIEKDKCKWYKQNMNLLCKFEIN